MQIDDFAQSGRPTRSKLRSKDYDLLVLGMELWKYDAQVFSELERLLGIRNDAAHPGMLTPSALDVQQFGTKVNDYVFAKVSC